MASATAAADCALLVLSRGTFLEVLREDANLAQHLIELLCERMRNNTETISDFAFLDLRGRLARKLHELAIAHGEQTKAGILIGLRLSQSELAQMLGVTREAVNKQLHAWVEKNVLRLDKGKVVVRDMKALKRAADPTRD